MDTNKTAHEHTDKDTLPASCPAFNDRHAIEVLPCWYDHLSFVSGRIKRLGQRKRSSEAAKPRGRITGSHVPQVLFGPRLQRLHRAETGTRGITGRLESRSGSSEPRAFAKVTDSSTFNSAARRSRALRRCPLPAARSCGSQHAVM